MSTVLTALRERREQLVTSMAAIAQPAADARRSFTEDEDGRWTVLVADLADLDARLTGIAEGEQRAAQAEATFGALLGGAPARPTPSLSNANKELDQAFRSAILERNPAPIALFPDHYRMPYQPAVEARDPTKGTATQALPVSVYNRVVAHLVENSAVIAAGATVVNTESGEVLQVPKSTAFVTSAITAEGVSITESDPTLAKVDLGAYKYASFFQVSSELAKDTGTDLLGFLAKQAAQSLALAFGPHLITGTGTGQPRGIITDATTGVIAPTGTATSFGVQATAGQGTDLLNDLYSSLAEPYTRSPSLAWMMRTATLGAVRRLKASTGELVGAVFAGPPTVAGSQANILGAPAFVDPSMAAMANAAKSTVISDMSRYFVRIAGGLTFDRSDDYAFQSDLISFRAMIRLDAASVDNSAAKVLIHTT
jgi:HK97 family phage major capsid protein